MKARFAAVHQLVRDGKIMFSAKICPILVRIGVKNDDDPGLRVRLMEHVDGVHQDGHAIQ
jgi:hypothetical protein